MKTTKYTVETAILVVEPDDMITKFDDVTKVVVKGSTIYVHRNKSGFDDIVKMENVVKFQEVR